MLEKIKKNRCQDDIAWCKLMSYSVMSFYVAINRAKLQCCMLINKQVLYFHPDKFHIMGFCIKHKLCSNYVTGIKLIPLLILISFIY
jgi:hypothetical protein